MNWKKLSFLFTLAFLISIGSSLTTWHVLNRHHKETQPLWKDLLSLTPEQEKKFSALEADFNLALKDIEVHDAQNKIFLCSFLAEGLKEPEMKSAIRKMAWVYQAKQGKIASALASMSAILTPDQRKIFSQTLMRQVCVSCRKSKSTDQCLCGMCGHHG